MPTKGTKREKSVEDLKEELQEKDNQEIIDEKGDINSEKVKPARGRKKSSVSKAETDSDSVEEKKSRKTSKKKDVSDTEEEEKTVKTGKTKNSVKAAKEEKENTDKPDSTKKIDKEKLLNKVSGKRKTSAKKEALEEEPEEEVKKAKTSTKKTVKKNSESEEIVDNTGVSLTDEILTKVKSSRKKTLAVKSDNEDAEFDKVTKTKKTTASKKSEKEKDETDKKAVKKTVTTKKNSVKDLIEEKMEVKAGVGKKSKAKTKRTKGDTEDSDKNSEDKTRQDITLEELLEQAQIQEEKDNVKKLRNISETIRADSSKRRKRKNDAALVMATLTGNQEAKAEMEEENVSIMAGFPIDVSGIDFEKERVEAEQECIEDFKNIVLDLSKDYEEINELFSRTKDQLIENLVELDKKSQFSMTELKMKQNDLVNRIAEIQEVILVKKSEFEKLGFTAFRKKNKIKQLIAESENEIAQLEMEGLGYNAKLVSIVDETSKERNKLFESLQIRKEKYDEVKKRLKDAGIILERMENREEIDENAVQKKLILKALRLYPKPMTIGQLLYYPGLSGYSVQRMSAAINQLVLEKSVLKVALEDNVYYVIANNNE